MPCSLRFGQILKAKHSFYGEDDIPIRIDRRWVPYWQHRIAPQISTAMRVLDVGCGDGTLTAEIKAAGADVLGCRAVQQLDGSICIR